MSSETIHLRPNAAVAERVLLPGDPGRALRLAQQLTDQPRMLNHNRGLWGYTGTAADGDLLTIQATGMGGPSAAIVAEELIRLGDLVIAETALPGDGASRALGAAGELPADPRLLAALRTAAPGARVGPVLSADLFYDPAPSHPPEALAIEMEAATIFAVAARHGLAAACILAVTDLVAGGERIGAEALAAAEERLGRAGAAATSSS